MKMQLKLPARWTLFAPLYVGTALGIPPVCEVWAQDPQEVTVQFAAMVGDQPFVCGQTYAGLGSSDAEIRPADFRFYVSDVALIDDSGDRVPLSLQQDGKWQYETVALLDFEDKSGPCGNGTEETRDRIVGTVPAGTYRGVQFTLGIPFDLNHADATLASSPLNLTSLWWNWQGGYKFVRIDLETPMDSMSMEGEPAPVEGGEHGHGAHGGESHSQASGFLIHLGSTGCQVSPGNQQPTSCANPNRVPIAFEGFDPDADVIVADLAALVADSDLMSNQPETALGCMSGPDDRDCSEIFANFGLDSADQSFFRVE